MAWSCRTGLGHTLPTEAVEAILDLEMPDPSRWRETNLSHAVTSEKLSPQTLDDRPRAVLRLVRRCAKSNIAELASEEES
jgi:beta-glucosidase